MFHRPARTLASVAGIGIGILLIVFTVGLANGTIRERASRESAVGAEIMFRAPGSIGLSGSDALRLPVALAKELEAVEGVAKVVPIATNSVSSGEGLTGTRFIDGIPFDAYAEVAGLKVVAGRKFEEGKDEMMADAAWLQSRKLRVGDKFSIYDRDFEIVGIYEPSVGARVKVPLSTMQTQLGSEGKASAFLVKIRDGHTPQQVGDALNARFPDNQIILTSELEELYMQGFPALNIFLDVVIGVAGVISALIILLTMYTTVTERTRQIGVLKSLGMSNFGIAMSIVKEAVLLSIGGVAFGVVATYLLKLVLSKWTMLNVAIDPEVVATIVIVGIVSSVIGALYPGIRAARLDAVEALNYD